MRRLTEHERQQRAIDAECLLILGPLLGQEITMHSYGCVPMACGEPIYAHGMRWWSLAFWDAVVVSTEREHFAIVWRSDLCKPFELTAFHF